MGTFWLAETDFPIVQRSNGSKKPKEFNPTNRLRTWIRSRRRRSKENRDQIGGSAYPNLVASSSYGGEERRGCARRRREVHGGALPAVKRRERRRGRRAWWRSGEKGFRRDANNEVRWIRWGWMPYIGRCDRSSQIRSNCSQRPSLRILR